MDRRKETKYGAGRAEGNGGGIRKEIKEEQREGEKKYI